MYLSEYQYLDGIKFTGKSDILGINSTLELAKKRCEDSEINSEDREWRTDGHSFRKTSYYGNEYVITEIELDG